MENEVIVEAVRSMIEQSFEGLSQGQLILCAAIVLALLLICPVIYGVLCCKLNRKKGYKGGFWTGFFLGFVGLIYMVGKPVKNDF